VQVYNVNGTEKDISSTADSAIGNEGEAFDESTKGEGPSGALLLVAMHIAAYAIGSAYQYYTLTTTAAATSTTTTNRRLLGALEGSIPILTPTPTDAQQDLRDASHHHHHGQPQQQQPGLGLRWVLGGIAMLIVGMALHVRAHSQPRRNRS
jgi:hypothetical protein